MLETAKQKESIEKYLGKRIIEKLENLPDKNRIKLKNEEDNIFGVKRSKTKHVEEMAKKETPENKKKKKTSTREAMENRFKTIENELEKIEEEKTIV